jgi:hypothetical protein
VLPLLLNTPRSVEDWARWSLHHRISHDVIRGALNSQQKLSLPTYLLDPINLGQPRNFLQWNQSAHIDMNAALKTPGSDLEDVNFNDERQMQAWVWLHYLEHSVIEQRLGVAS